MQHNTSAGRHRRRATQRITVAGVVPLVITIAIAGAANADPGGQPGVTPPSTGQPGVSAPAGEQPGVTPAPAPAPEPEVQPSYWYDPGPQADYRSYAEPAPSYSQPSYEQPSYSQPSYQPEESQSPPPMAGNLELAKPIKAPPKMLRIGQVQVQQSVVGLNDLDLERTNNQLAVAEAGTSNLYRALGWNASRADKTAAATLTGAALGGLSAGAGGAVVGGVIGAVPGALIGGGVGGGMGMVLVPGIGLVPGVEAGAVVGAGIGAAAGAAIGGVTAGAVGAAAGGAAGFAFGAGAPDEAPLYDLTPQAAPAPEPIVVDAAAITAQTERAVAQVETIPGGTGAVESVRSFVADTPPIQQGFTNAVTTQVDVVREAAVAQPGGGAAIAQVDAAVANASAALGPISGQIDGLLKNVHAGLG